MVVLTGGGPIDLREICELADAVVMTWYSGEAGGEALSDLLFGDANFSGRLPVTFPESVEKLPPFEDYSMRERTYKYMTDNILFPFGYGLSYGKVIYGDAEARVNEDRTVTVSVDLKNPSEFDIDETVQFYHASPEAGNGTPRSELVAFSRERIAAGQSRRVSVQIPLEHFETVLEDGSRTLLKGVHTLHVSSAAPTYRNAALEVSDRQATVEL